MTRRGLRVALPGLSRVPPLPAPGDFPTTDALDEAGGNPPPEPEDAGLRMLVGTAQREDPVGARVSRSGDAKLMVLLMIFADQPPQEWLAPRRGLGLVRLNVSKNKGL